MVSAVDLLFPVTETDILSEHMADVFGSMVKQWRGGVDPQLAADADWLIGAGIFNPKTKIVAIRSMKEPGTAYKNPLIGTDPQVGHMAQYADLPDDEGHDVSTVQHLQVQHVRLLTIGSGMAYTSTPAFQTKPSISSLLGLEVTPGKRPAESGTTSLLTQNYVNLQQTATTGGTIVFRFSPA